MSGIGRWRHKPLGLNGAQPMPLHLRTHQVATRTDTLGVEFRRDPACPIASPMPVKDGFDTLAQSGFPVADNVARAASIIMIGAARHAHHAAQQPDRVTRLRGCNELVSLYPLLPKISAAFFKMSRSISTSHSFLRKAMTSFSESELASTASRFHLWSKLSAQPNSRTTEATDCPS